MLVALIILLGLVVLCYLKGQSHETKLIVVSIILLLMIAAMKDLPNGKKCDCKCNKEEIDQKRPNIEEIA